MHFNDKRPEYKNIFITNMQNNLAYVFNGDKFEATFKEHVLYELFNTHLDNIESFIKDNDIQECFRNRNLFKFIREVNGEDSNKEYPDYKLYKLNSIKQVIYNNSDKNLFKNLNKINLKEAIVNDSEDDCDDI